MTTRRETASKKYMKEADLYPVVAEYLRARGYVVHGEVCGCDLVAIKGDELVIVELKVAPNLKLYYQAVRRLAITPHVYIAFFRSEAKQKMSYWQMLKSLARRLHVGVYVVHRGAVSVLADPAPFAGRVSTKQRRKVLKELSGRRISENVGGVRGTKLNTAYLENAVYISVLLQKHKTLSAAALRALGTGEKTHATLYRNHYGWFERKGAGRYTLKKGQAARIQKSHPKIWKYYRDQL